MTLLDQELRDMPDDQLRDLVARLDDAHTVGGTAALIISPLRTAARKELDNRPTAARAIFPVPLVPHGTSCPPGCCGAGVRQWR